MTLYCPLAVRNSASDISTRPRRVGVQQGLTGANPERLQECVDVIRLVAARWHEQVGCCRSGRRWRVTGAGLIREGLKTQGNRISSCPCQYLQQVPCIETAKESFLPDAEGSGAFLS